MLETRKRPRRHPAQQQTRWVNPAAIEPDPGWYPALLVYPLPGLGLRGRPWKTLREVWKVQA